MSHVRKTVPVALIIERANHFLAESDDDKQAERYAIGSLVETLLLNAQVNAYAGFNYLPAAGVNYDAIKRGEDFDADDESRRRYYLHHKAH